MLNFDERDITFIKENIENAEAILISDNLNEVLDAIMDVQMYKGFDKGDLINDFGRLAERVYDNIFYNN